MQSALNLYGYIKKNQAAALNTFQRIQFYKPDEFLMLDGATQRNLELVRNNNDGTRAHSLWAVLDQCATPMGSRTMKKWLLQPSVDIKKIEARHDAVAQFIASPRLSEQWFALLQSIGDIERVVGRIALTRAQKTDYVLLKQALVTLVSTYELYTHTTIDDIQQLQESIHICRPLADLLHAALHEDSAADSIIKPGFNAELDQLRDAVHNADASIAALEAQEQKLSGIASLKIRYNQVHGYYIEVTKPNLSLVPDYFIRHQTLVGKERFTTARLKEVAHTILYARAQLDSFEKEIFESIKISVTDYIPALRKVAHLAAYYDCLLGFARAARAYNYVRPIIRKDGPFAIVDGRHPVIYAHKRHTFVPNDTFMDTDSRVGIITGPNMGGKSTYLRQVALISIMTHCGSFVPARSAEIPLLDRIFTRIGAGDNVAEGKSTFLVEMEETATICRFATERSLVILDEVGRGTSTFDGLAIAQAVLEYLHSTVRAYTLFATHYHALTRMADNHAGIVNYYAASKRTTNGFLLLYKIMRGSSDGSFGIDVARMAQLPESIVARAATLLQELEYTEYTINERTTITPALRDLSEQRQIIEQLQKQCDAQQAVIDALQAIDLDSTTPKQVFDLVWRLKQGL
jgi:DNA mismatch repair protein MutS